MAGLYLAYSFQRQQRLKIAEQRINAHRQPWSVMGKARPSRLGPPERAGPLSAGEAREVYDAATSWYFGHGNGMMVTEPTRCMYLEAKRRLGEYATGEGDPGEVANSEGERRMRELSLLRTPMKFDLAIYGVIYPDVGEGPGRLDELEGGPGGRGCARRPLRIRIRPANGRAIRRPANGLRRVRGLASRSINCS